jgi:CheY-like chemotaxis protein
LGNVDLAAEDVGPDHPAAVSLAEIARAGARASELVRRIMAFARPHQPRREVTDLAAVVEEVLKLLRSTLPATIALTKHLERNVPRALADAAQVHEVVVNLTVNAAHAIGRRAGSIDYLLQGVDPDQAARVNLLPGRYVRLTVKDNGCGMDEAIKSRIFDAFYTTKPVGEGTGLGLSMVYGIMQSYGGTVTVESAPGEGSSFHAYFPAADEVNKPQAPATAATAGLAAGRRLMYVDDEEALVCLGERMLTRFGYTVSGFSSPKDALEAFRANAADFDVVVTDLAMPQMSGLSFTRELLAIRKDIPVLLTTGNISAEDEVGAREAGIRELVLKPVTVEELAKVLERLYRTPCVQA